MSERDDRLARGDESWRQLATVLDSHAIDVHEGGWPAAQVYAHLALARGLGGGN